MSEDPTQQSSPQGRSRVVIILEGSMPSRFLFFPTRQEGVVRFYVGICVCDASTPRPHPVSRQSSSPVDPAEYPARAARQWIPPVSRQSSSPVDPAQYPAKAARRWIPPSSGSRRVSRPSGSPWIPPSGGSRERLASKSRQVSRQSSWPVDLAQYPARAARQWIPPSIPPEQLVSGSRRVSRQSCLPVDPAQYPARAARQWIPPSIPPASGSSPRIPPEGFCRVSR